MYYSTVALCGITAERMCYDWIDLLEIKVGDKLLDSKSKEYLYNLPYKKLIELLEHQGIITTSTKNLLHQISDKRNQYVHPKMTQDVKKDAKEVINNLCTALSNGLSLFNFYEWRADGRLYKKS